MNIKQIREIAKTKGVKTGNMKKETMIRAIQRAEGNYECFGTAVSGECDQTNCLWRTDCLK
ncbi:MAG: SAP domain-containing protein [Nitrospirota bacterium]